MQTQRTRLESEDGLMNSGDHAETKPHSGLRFFLSILGLLAFSFIIALLMRQFVLQPYNIPTGSMETTIMVDDKVFSEKITYLFNDIENGEIVTFEDKEIPGRILIKRVIATGGETIDLVDGFVSVNGVVLDEPYVNNKRSDPLSHTLVDITYPYTVPEDCIWVMGDNRTNSQDSRYFGPVEKSRVTGKGFLLYWPLEHFTFLG